MTKNQNYFQQVWHDGYTPTGSPPTTDGPNTTKSTTQSTQTNPTTNPTTSPGGSCTHGQEWSHFLFILYFNMKKYTRNHMELRFKTKEESKIKPVSGQVGVAGLISNYESEKSFDHKQYYPDENDCQKYHLCNNGDYLNFQCGPGLSWDTNRYFI